MLEMKNKVGARPLLPVGIAKAEVCRNVMPGAPGRAATRWAQRHGPVSGFQRGLGLSPDLPS